MKTKKLLEKNQIPLNSRPVLAVGLLLSLGIMSHAIPNYELQSTHPSGIDTNDPDYVDGYINVVTQYGAIANDSSAAVASSNLTNIQQAIDDAHDHGRVTYFPSGTYYVDGQLNCWQQVKPDGKADKSTGFVLVGNKYDAPSVIRLKNASNDFQVATDNGCNAMINIWSQAEYNVANPVHKGRAGLCYGHSLRHLTIETGNNNPGAVGVRFAGAQGSGLQSVTIDATGSYAAIYNLPGQSGGLFDSTIIGGEYGVKLPYYGDTESTSKDGTSGPTINGCIFIDQTKNAVSLTGASPMLMVGFKIVNSVSTDPAIFFKRGNSINLIDGSIEYTGATAPHAIQNTNRIVYLQNILVKNATNIVKNDAGNYSNPDASSWTLVKEYIKAGNGTDRFVNGNEQFQDFIDDTAYVSDSVATDAVTGFIEMHIWDELPSRHDPGVIFLSPTGGNDTTQINNALQSGETGSKVFLRRGTYRVSDSIELGEDDVLFGASRIHTIIRTHANWDTSVAQKAIVQTSDSATSKAVLTSLSIQDDKTNNHPNVTYIKWRAGENSMAHDVWTVGLGSAPKRNFKHIRHLIEGNGGGRFSTFSGIMTEMRANHPDSAGYVIKDTTQTLRFYALNVEHVAYAKNGQVRFDNASNVYLYQFKFESGAPGLPFFDDTITNTSHANYAPPSSPLVGKRLDYQSIPVKIIGGTNVNVFTARGFGSGYDDTLPVVMSVEADNCIITSITQYGGAGNGLRVSETYQSNTTESNGYDDVTAYSRNYVVSDLPSGGGGGSGSADYTEDFEDGLAQNWSTAGFTIGGGTMDQSGTWQFATTSSVGLDLDDDYSVAYEGQATGSRSEAYASPILVLKHQTNSNWAYIYIKHNNAGGTRELIFKSKTDATGANEHPLALTGGSILQSISVTDMHTLKAQVSGNTLNVWVNGNLEVSNATEDVFSDDSFNSNTVCGVRSPTATGGVLFEKFEFWDNDGGVPSNNPPSLTAIANQNVNENASLQVNLFASDPESHSITFSATGLPSFGTLTDNGDGTGTIDFTPEYSDSGPYNITVTADDGNGRSDSDLFTLTVNNVNSAPSYTAIADVTMDEGDTLQVSVHATDADGDTMTLTVAGLPSYGTWTETGNGTGTIDFAPGYLDSGAAITITVNANDGNGGSTDEVFDITVDNVNRAPVLDAILSAPFAVDEGGSLVVNVSASDPDGDSLVLAATATGMNFATTAFSSGSGTLTFDPVAGDAGVYSVTVTVDDSSQSNNTDSEVISLTVNTPPSPSEGFYYENDFESGSVTPDFAEDASHYSITGGKLKPNVGTEWKRACLDVAGASTLTDYTIEVNAKTTDPGPNSKDTAAVLLRYQNPNQYYLVQVDKNGKLWVRKRLQGTSWHDMGSKNGFTQDVEFKIEIYGSSTVTIDVYIDNVLELSEVDDSATSPYTSGPPTFEARNTDGVEFDNMVVYDEPPAVGSNLVLNPSFENYDANNPAFDWALNTAAVGQTINTSWEPVDGARHVFFRPTTGGFLRMEQWIPVNAGSFYTAIVNARLSDDLQGGNGARCTVAFFNAAKDTQIGSQYNVTDDLFGTIPWTEYTQTGMEALPNAAFIRLRLICDNATPGPNAEARFDRITVFEE